MPNSTFLYHSLQTIFYPVLKKKKLFSLSWVNNKMDIFYCNIANKPPDPHPPPLPPKGYSACIIGAQKNQVVKKEEEKMMKKNRKYIVICIHPIINFIDLNLEESHQTSHISDVISGKRKCLKNFTQLIDYCIKCYIIM